MEKDDKKIIDKETQDIFKKIAWILFIDTALSILATTIILRITGENPTTLYGLLALGIILEIGGVILTQTRDGKWVIFLFVFASVFMLIILLKLLAWYIALAIIIAVYWVGFIIAVSPLFTKTEKG
jgi:hypothetical protein